jgi:hypothetical protein
MPASFDTVEVRESCRVTLTTEELLAAGQELAASQLEISNLEGCTLRRLSFFTLPRDFKSVRDDWKSRISAVQARITNLAGRISRGYDIRQVPCIVTMDSPEPGMKTCNRLDTNERVWVREMSESDKQLVLDLRESQEAEELAEEQGIADGTIVPLDEPTAGRNDY